MTEFERSTVKHLTAIHAELDEVKTKVAVMQPTVEEMKAHVLAIKRKVGITPAGWVAIIVAIIVAAGNIVVALLLMNKGG
jgi:hypothetical protein